MNHWQRDGCVKGGAYSPCWLSDGGVARVACRRWACAWAECSPSLGRDRFAATSARVYCRPGCHAPGSRTARSSDTRSRWETWLGALRRTRMLPLLLLTRERVLLSLLVSLLLLRLFVQLPTELSMHRSLLQSWLRTAWIFQDSARIIKIVGTTMGRWSQCLDSK